MDVEEVTFDIIGINPLNEDGVYLCCSNMTWYPLWSAVCTHTPELTSRDYQTGSMNDDLLIEGEKLFGIIRALDDMVSGTKRSDIDETTWENLKALLRFCESNEGFRIC